MSEDRDGLINGGVAIIGMVGRFPGAPDVETFWRNVCEGTETIARFTDDQLRQAGVPAEFLQNPAYVKARGILEEVDRFDPAFFGYSGRDALLMDPQQRLYLECCWQALEHAGYDPRAYGGLIGVYGGATASSYHPHLYSHLDLLPNPDPLSIAIGNELPFLTTRVSYKLDLKGPSCPVQTACSTSLVAVHLAAQGLLNAECDMALAGGVSVRLPQESGYWYQDESILSPDGYCRSFDAAANGTVFSNGIGVVVLKRLEDAVADGDTIYAVIRGSAINNDGSRRASFTAPGVFGQSQVIADALTAAAVSPDTIGYIEAHGTATALGDSIEVQALNKAFGRGTSRKQFCAIGAVKANIGHLDAAAGVAGLIKAALMLHHRQLPPAAMFERPNPDLHLESTPFYVNTALREWARSNGTPRRAGVSSFGFGGTNAHVVLEEAPARDPGDASREHHVIVVSAESGDALERATSDLAQFFGRHARTGLPDAAYTLQVGRRAFRHRRAVVGRTVEEVRGRLESRDPRFVFSSAHDGPETPVVFMFPGQGSQHPGMARGLYDAEPLFRSIVDDCAGPLRGELGLDIRALMFPEPAAPDAAERLTRTAYAQPALFVIEYALARLWMSWGVQPAAMIGHSVGELVAATLAGVMALPDALRLVALRGRLMDEMPAGVMLAVPLPEAHVRRMLGDALWLAAVNAPSMCVVSGGGEAIGALETRLREEGVEAQRLQTSHAFHSGLMDAAVPPFVDGVRRAALGAPSIPFISNVTGAWITEGQATDPQYWGRQIREAVRFADGAAELMREGDRIYLEAGPGQALSTLMRRQGGRGGQQVIPSLRRPAEDVPDGQTMAAALGRLWAAGARVEWDAYYGEERRRRVPLPTYAFDRQRFWVSRPQGAAKASTAPRQARGSGRLATVSDWLYVPTWTRQPRVRSTEAAYGEPATWLVFADRFGVADACVERLTAAGHAVVTVRPSGGFAREGTAAFTIDPFRRPDYDQLVKALAADGRVPDRVLHCWGVGGDPDRAVDAIVMDRDHHVMFWSLALTAQALADGNVNSPVQLTVVTTGAQDVTGSEPLSPGKATGLALSRVIPQEHPNVSCRTIDVAPVSPGGWRRADAEALLAEAAARDGDAILAYRAGHRWVQAFAPVPLEAPDGAPARLRSRGVYLITGGLGDIALNMAEYLARTVQARLVLVGRTGLPAEGEWDQDLRSRGPQDATAQRIARVRRIQAAGGEVLVLQADAASYEQMARAFAEADARFGAVHGVIHAAGLIAGDAFRPILETDEDAVKRQFQPKVDGLSVLDALIRDRALDFCMLVSSLSAILGGLRYGAYAAANAFMDLCAARRNRTSAFPWITVNWDGWLRAEDEAALRRAGRPVAGFVMTGAEGIDALARILAHDAGRQIVVSTGDLQARVEQWVRMAGVDAAPAASDQSSVVRLPRPNLQTEYVAPRTDLERTLAAVWQEMLGLEKAGVNDSFFELGGDSLLGIQVISRLKKDLNVKISAVTLYEGPTVAALARVIEASRATDAAADGGAVDASRQRGERRRERKLKMSAPAGPVGA